MRALLRSPELALLKDLLTAQQAALYRQGLQPGLPSDTRAWNAAQQALLGQLLGDTLPQQLFAVIGIDTHPPSKSDFDNMDYDLGPETH